MLSCVIGTPPGALSDPCDIRSGARNGANGANVAALCVAQGMPAAAIGSYTFPTTATGNVTAGNINLTPEEADTYNLGFVFNAPSSAGAVRRFLVLRRLLQRQHRQCDFDGAGPDGAVAMFNLDGSNPTYDANNAACSLISRDTTGQLLTVSTPYQNLGTLETDGIEIRAHWGLAPLRGDVLGGTLYLDTAVSWLNSYGAVAGNAPTIDYTGISAGGAQPASTLPATQRPTGARSRRSASGATIWLTGLPLALPGIDE